MRLYLFRFYTYIPGIFVFRLPCSLIGIMASTLSNNINVLIQRLNEAERRAKLLNNEVKSIKQQITLLKSSVNTIPTTSIIEIIPSTSNSRTSLRLRSITSSEDDTDGLQENKRTKSSFNEENGYVVVYTDGACENNGRANAKAGVGVWFGQNHPLNISEPVKGKATNNTAEIQACVQALKLLESQGINKVKIITDSQFTINCMTKWIKNWKRNHWKTASGGPVKNKEDLQILDEVINRFEDVTWTHVAGHRGVQGNEEADKLARDGAIRYRPS